MITQLNRIQPLRKAGYIKRYHTVPTVGDSQTVSAHSWGVATLINEIWPDATKQVLLASLYHDVAEVLIGDMPATVKWKYAEFASALEKVEAEAEQELDLEFALSLREKRQLKIADMLELMLYAGEQVKIGNMHFKEVLSNGKEYLLMKYGSTVEFQEALPMFNYALTRISHSAL